MINNNLGLVFSGPAGSIQGEIPLVIDSGAEINFNDATNRGSALIIITDW